MRTILYVFICCIILQSCNDKKWIKLDKAQTVEHFTILKESHSNVYNRRPLLYNEDIAINAAEVYLFDRYGMSNIKNERPYQIGKIDNFWVIVGSFASKKNGGYFEIVIDANNGEVLKMIHGE